MCKKCIFLVILTFMLFELTNRCLAEEPNDATFKQRRNIVITYINSGNFAEAQISLDKLTADFNGHRLLPKSLQNIGRRYEMARQYQDANSVYRQIIQIAPGSIYASEAQFDIPRSNILRLLDSGRISEGETAIDRLLTDFSDRSDLPELLSNMAALFAESDKYEQAKAVIEKIVSHYPGSVYAFKAQRNLAILAIEEDELSDSAQAVNKLIADFVNDPNLSRVLYQIARKYELSKKLELAKQVYQQIVPLDPNSSYSTQSTFDAARINILNLLETGKTDEVLSAVDGFITDFHENTNTPRVLGDIARLFWSSKRYRQAKVVNEVIIRKYPGTDNAFEAQRSLVLLALASGKTDEYRSSINKLIEDYRGNSSLPKTLYSIARRCEIMKNYPEAQNLYQKIINFFPSSTYAEKSHLDLARTDVLYLINSALTDEAQIAIDSLIANFNDHPDLPVILHDIAGVYSNLKMYIEAKDCYQQVTKNYPDSNIVQNSDIAARKADILSFIQHGDNVNAQSEIDKMVADFNQNPDFPQTLYEIAEEYESYQLYGEANDVYQRIISSCPNSQIAVEAELDTAKLNILTLIDLNDDANALTAVDKIMTNFNTQGSLLKKVITVGEKYYNEAFWDESEKLYNSAQENFPKAITVWEKAIEEFPQTDDTASAYYFSAICYRKLGEYEKAIECYRKLLDKWPDYEYAWNALFLIGRNYEKLEKSGAISKTKANSEIRTVYKQLLDIYPDCPAAKYVGHWLSSHN